MLESVVGLPVWLWAVLLLALIVIGWWMSRQATRQRRTAEREAMAQRADGQHEGIQTHHQGGD